MNRSVPWLVCGVLLFVSACGDDDSSPADGTDSADQSEVETEAGDQAETEVPEDVTPEDGAETGGCSIAADCDDGLYCNGEETCDPTDSEADDEGCVLGTPPCPADPGCDEDADRCRTDCEANPDLDGDTFNGVDCGGDDCNDSDPDVNPDATEVCDEEGVDEDCDPDTVGDRDLDGDGSVDGACCNGTECGPDCNDARSEMHGGATEVCDGLDNDCDGTVDEGVTVAGFADVDRDLHGDPAAPVRACAGARGVSTVDDDCDDINPTVHGAQIEICDGLDNDCDGDTDENAAPVPWYRDNDGDGYGTTAGGVVVSCTPPAGYGLFNTDCNDADPDVSPGSAELCDGLDTNCDGLEDFVIGPGDFEDDDRDGVADAACGGDDCNDRDNTTYDRAGELCDGRDNDCDGTVDEGAEPLAWYVDADHDGWGDGVAVSYFCELQEGRVLRDGDCDDGDGEVRPGMPDDCGTQIGVDDDCDGDTDEDAEGQAWYADRDGDGWGAGSETFACEAPAETVGTIGDCNDLVTELHPTADESCAAPNLVDDDCDGDTDCDDSDCFSFANCVPTYRLTLISGDAQSKVITGEVDAPVVVELTNIASGGPVGSAALTLVTSEGVAPPGAGATATDGSGRASFTYRMGRQPGPVWLSVRYAGARSLRITGTAVAPAAGVIVPLVNAEDLGTVARTPGPGTLLSIVNGQHLEVHADGTAFIPSYDYCTLYSLSAAGTLARYAGNPTPSCRYTGDFGAARDSYLNNPADVALDRGRDLLFIADYTNDVIRYVDLASGVIRTYAGGGSAPGPGFGDGGPAADADLGGPSRVEVASDGTLYIAANTPRRVRVVDPDTRIITTRFTEGGVCSGALTLCTLGTLALDASDRLILAGAACGSEVGDTVGPCGAATNARAIVRVESGGALTLLVGDRAGSRTGTPLAVDTLLLSGVADMDFAPDGDLVFVETAQHVVWRVDSVTARATIVAGTGTAGFSGDYGRANLARLDTPKGVEVDAAGHIYIADSSNAAVRMIW